MIDLTPLVNAFIVLLGAVITAFLVPYIKRKINEAQLIELAKWVEVDALIEAFVLGLKQNANT